MLHGIGAGILVVADLTCGTGRFNLTHWRDSDRNRNRRGAQQAIAKAIVHHFSDRAGFIFLASVAAVALLILWLLMPETLEWNPAAPRRRDGAS